MRLGRAQRSHRSVLLQSYGERAGRRIEVDALEAVDWTPVVDVKPGIGPLAGWRGADGTQPGRGAPNPHQLDRYVENGCFWKHELSHDQLYFKHANKAYLEGAVAMGLLDAAERAARYEVRHARVTSTLARRHGGAPRPPVPVRRRASRSLEALALENARENAALNSLARKIRFATTPLARLRPRFDLITANILSSTLIAMATTLTRLLARRGRLVLGGILNREAPAVLRSYGQRLRCLGVRRDRGWSTLVLAR